MAKIPPARAKTQQKLLDKLLRWAEIIGYLKGAEDLLDAAFEDGIFDADEMEPRSLYDVLDELFDLVRAAVPTE